MRFFRLFVDSRSKIFFIKAALAMSAILSIMV